MSDISTAVVDAVAFPPLSDLISAAVVDVVAVEVAGQATLALGPVPHQAMQGGLGIAPVDYSPPDLYMEVFDPDDPDTPLVGTPADGYDGTLGSAYERTFTDVFNGEGRVGLRLLNGDPVAALVTAGRFLRVRYKGVWAFLARVGPRSQQTLAAVSPASDSAEESDEDTSIDGTEALGSLSEAIVYPGRWLQGPNPKPKEQDRQFNAGSAPYDDSGWQFAVELQRQGTPAGLVPPVWDNYPPAFPDPDAYWVAGGDGTLEEAPALATMYDRRTFFIGTLDGDASRSVRLYYGADDFVTVFVDAQQMSETLDINSRFQLRYVDFDLTDGEHTFFFVVGNIGAWEPFNPMGLVWTAQEMVSGEPIGVLTDSIALVPIHSSSYDKVLWNPAEPPGLTAGQIILTVIFEMIARNVQTFWEWDFTVYTDSNGDAWPIIPNFVTTVGGDLREMLRAMMTAGLVDIRVDPYRPLIHAYIGGSFTTSSGVSFGVPVEGVDHSLSELVHDDDGPRANVLLVEFANGRIEVEAPGVDFDVTPRVEAALNLGRVPDEATAREQALAVLVTASVDYNSVGAGWEPADTAHDPYVNPLLIPGKLVDIANRTLDDVDPVLFSALTVTEDDNGNTALTPELADLAAVSDQLTHAWLERSAPGQLGGVYPIGSVPAPPDYTSPPARVPGYAFVLGATAGTVANTPIHVRLQIREAIFTRWDNANVESTTGTSVATIYVNGAAIATVTISPGEATQVESLVMLVGALQPGLDTIGVELTTSSAADHTLLIRTEYL